MKKNPNTKSSLKEEEKSKTSEMMLMFEANLPSHLDAWKERGRKILSPDKWKQWDKIVPIRANDLYHGMELNATLDIIEILNQSHEDSFKRAKQALYDQNHSGMSFSLVCAMLEEFSDKGIDFVKYVRN